MASNGSNNDTSTATIPETSHLERETSMKSKITYPPQPIRGNQGATIIGPTNPAREAQDPDLVAPPSTDRGTLPNLRWSYADSHMRLSEGGWGRQTTIRELPAAKEVAGVNMRLKAGGVLKV